VSQAHVVVVGGGLAGMAAGLRLARAGCQVTLLEGRWELGGLTRSYPRGDLTVDNGQHVFLRCCTAYRSFLDEIGSTALTTLQPRLDVPVVRAGDGRRARLRRDRHLPVPLHLTRALLGYAVLPVADRLRVVRGALALRHVDRTHPATDDRAFGDWLRDHGQTRAAVDALWDLVGVATLNLPANEASLAVAATVFQLGLLEQPDAADLGWSQVPLQRLHADTASRALRAAGAVVRTRSRVRAVLPAGSGWTVALDGDALDADAVVVAVEPQQAESLLPTGAVAQRAGWSRRLGSSPIVDAHLVLDRPVLTGPLLAAIGSPVQWVFDRTASAGLTAGQYLALSLSAADDLVDRPVADLRALLLPEVRRLLPAARAAQVLDFFVTRERHATFRAGPGTRRDRPSARTALPGLALAGAYTDTGWPATMESAVRSGRAAADLLLASLARDRQGVPA